MIKTSQSGFITLLSTAITLAAVSSPALAQINGLFENPRVFNDFSTSLLTITNSNSIPGNVTIDDRRLVDDGMGGNFANRHDILLSSDNGASANVFAITEPFEISVDVNLSVGNNAPRKEAGIRVNSPVTGDALFLVNSDAGEIVAFGGPFFSFGSNGTGNGYTPGTEITLGMRYVPGTPGAFRISTGSRRKRPVTARDQRPPKLDKSGGRPRQF